MRLPTAGPTKVLALGVYPSAFHVAWSPPSSLDPRSTSDRRRPFIASLAVDVEPVVFWDGQDPSAEVLLQRWKKAVAFDDDRHGRVSLGTNGPSGDGLIGNVLDRLGVKPDEVAFTDAVPWFMVKGGKGSQGDAIATRFAPLAPTLEVHPGSLPPRPAPRALVALCAGDRRASLRREILQSEAPLVVTLGQEALAALCAVDDGAGPEGCQRELAPDGYGQVGSVVIDGRALDLLPLVLPGFQRQTKRTEWVEAFETWQAPKP